MAETDYKKLYSELFNGITTVIEELKTLQAKTEELFISDENNNLLEDEYRIKAEQKTPPLII